jgi:hypothetical protein
VAFWSDDRGKYIRCYFYSLLLVAAVAQICGEHGRVPVIQRFVFVLK